MTSKSDPLGLRSDDPIQRWRDDAERLEEQCAAARRQRKQEERRIMTTSEVAALEARVAELEGANRELRADLAEVMRAIAASFDTLSSEPAQTRSDIHRLDIEMAKLATQVTELRAKECADLAGVMSAIAANFATLTSERADLSAQTRNELHRLGTQMATLGSEVAELREQRARGFQFAREKGEVEGPAKPIAVAPNSLIPSRGVRPQDIGRW
jgi:chromosome segregation ATPase